MLKKLRWALALMSMIPGIASAGWIIEWEHTPVRAGERLESKRAIAYIEDDKTRVEQDHITTVYDYDEGTFTLLNPTSRYYWSAGVDDYVKESVRNRDRNLRKKLGTESEDDEELPEVDLESLPEISVEATDEMRTIAGHQAFKHVVRVNEELFQEIWVANDLDLSGDLDPDKVVKFQARSSRGMIGNSSKPYNALYRSPAYLELLKKGYALRTLTHHIAGAFDRKARSVREADVEDSKFEVPAGYRKVSLQEVFKTETEETE